MTHRRSRPHRRRLGRVVASLLVATAVLAACGSDSEVDRRTTAGRRRRPAAVRRRPPTRRRRPRRAAGDGELTSLTIGYSAWPGWFPLAVADKEGIFTEAGLKVDLKYFADYTASLDALVAGQLDVNAQTLNDTIFAVASGARAEDRRRRRQLHRQRRRHLRRVDHLDRGPEGQDGRRRGGRGRPLPAAPGPGQRRA